MKTFILGAGCSRNYSEGVTQISGLKPPLDRDFFKMAKKVITSNPGYSWIYSIDHLTRDIESFYGVKYDNELEVLDDSRLSLETVFTLFQMRDALFESNFTQFGVNRSLGTSERRISMLIQLIAMTIDEALRGPICRKHQRLSQLLEKNDYVINFNYDILMDLALRKNETFNDQSYLLNFHKIYDGEEWVTPEQSLPDIKMAKLHGSLNWLRCSHCNSLLLLRNQKVGDWYNSLPSVEKCPKCNYGLQSSERMLIPPLLIKNYADPNIRYLWNESIHNLRLSNELVFIGYSLPPTDFATETLFRVALSNRQNDINVSLVNPSDSVVNRYSLIFNLNKINHYKTLVEYLESQ